MNKIKILVDAHVFDGEFQGTRTFIKEIYSSLAMDDRFEIFLAAYDINNIKNAFQKFPLLKFIKYRSKSSIVRLLWDIPSMIKQYKIDYVHFQYIISPIKTCKFIVTIHDVIFYDYPSEFSWLYKMKRKLLWNYSAQKADILTTVSEYSKQSIITHLGIKSNKIHVIPNGVNEIYFASYNKSEARSYISEKYKLNSEFILYVSRIEPRKNHYLLVKNYLDLQLYKKNIHLVLLGHQSIRVPQLDIIFKKLPSEILNFILINEKVDDYDLLKFYQASRFFVYPSKAEGFGIPPLEAGALKIPVLCSNASAMSDFSFFENFHIHPEDMTDFKSKMRFLSEQLPDQDFLDKVSNTISDKYNWNHSAMALNHLLV